MEKKHNLAYFTGWHQKTEASVEGKYYPNLCCKSRMAVLIFFSIERKNAERMQKCMQVSLNTMLKDNKIKTLQICNYNPEPWHNGQIRELCLNLKPSATWEKFSVDLGLLLMLRRSCWQSGGQSQVSQWTSHLLTTKTPWKFKGCKLETELHKSLIRL